MLSGRRTLLLIVCLFVVTMGGLYAVSQSRAVRQQALRLGETLLAESLGWEVQIEEVRLRPWLAAVDLVRVRIASGPRLSEPVRRTPDSFGVAGSEGTLFTAEAIRARWSWTALFRRRLEVRRLLLIHPQIMLPTGASPGLRTEDLLSAVVHPPRREIRGWGLVVRQARVREGRVTWVEADGIPVALEGVEGVLEWSESAGELPRLTGSLRAACLRQGSGEAQREIGKIVLEVTGTADALAITTAGFEVSGLRVTAEGLVQEPGRLPRLDLRLGLTAPLDSLLAALHASRRMEGGLSVNGRLQGPWGQPTFQGEGTLKLGSHTGRTPPLRFAVRWVSGRLEAATLPSPPQPESFRGTLALEPATGTYQATASVTKADLAALTGLPGALATLVGLQLPSDLRGSLTADLDLAGRGADVTTLRGHARLRVDDLGVPGETPAGRLDARVIATSTALQVETFVLSLPGGDVQGRGGLTFGNGRLDLPLRAELRDLRAFALGFGLPSLAGRAAFIGRLAGTRDLPLLQGRLQWREARIAAQTFDQIDGEVQAASRTIRTSRLTLRTGRTVATLSGSVTAAGTMPLRTLDWKRDLILDLSGQLNPSRTADLIALWPEELEIQGGLRASGHVTGPLQALTGDVRLQLENVRTWNESWQRGDALLQFQGGGVEIGQISLRRGGEQLTGQIQLAADGGLRGVLTSSSMDLIRVGFLAESQLTGRASFRLDLQGTLRETRTLGQATWSALAYRSIPLGPGIATFTIARKTVDVDLTIQEGAYRLQAAFGPPPQRSLRATLWLRDAGLALPLQVAQVSAPLLSQGRGSGRINVQGPAGDLTASQGEIEFDHVVLQPDAEVWESPAPVRASWRARTLTLDLLRLRSGDHQVEIRGTVGEGDSTDLTVSGSLPVTALPRWPPAVRPTGGLAVANLRVRGSWGAPSLEGGLTIQQGGLALSGLRPEFSQVQATLDITDDRTEVRDWQARLAEGSFHGGAEIRSQDGRWRLRTTFQEDGGRAEQFLTGLYGGKGEVTGSLSLGGVLTSEGEAAADFWRNLDGDLKLAMTNGRIGSYTVLAKLLSLLNVVQTLQLKSPELSADGMPYQSLTADIKIQHGIARTENLVLDSRAMKVNAVGTVNLAEDTVNLKVAIKPFQTVDSIISHIPLAGWLLAGKEKSLVVAYYQVTGSLQDPRVTAIPLESVGRNVFGVFKNILELPEVLTGPYGDLPPQAQKPDEGRR